MPQLTRGAFALPGTSLNFKTGNWRSTVKPSHYHFKAPCHAACPAGEDQQAWLAELQDNHPHKAWLKLVEANPMPSVTGRVCPHPCETACNRKDIEGAVAIHNVERWLGDEAAIHNWEYEIDSPKADAKTVAIIGAGPGGISAAYHLVRLGIKAEIYEAAPEAGGLLRSAIPPTRLPRDVLDKELNRILSLPGIKLNTRMRLGRDVTIDGLLKTHAAVILGVGCGKGKHWDIGGALPSSFHEGLDLLREFMDHGKFPEANNVIVHGGGNTAIDLCRLMKRSGVQNVTLVTASGLPGPETDADDIINVVPRELEEAIEEGINIIPHATVKRLIMKGSRTTGIEIVSLKKIPDEKGRKKRVEFFGTERIMDADMVIPCIGEMVDAFGLEGVLSGNYLKAKDEFCGLERENVYAIGDARGDRGTVAEAIGDGRKAAIAIAARLNGFEPQSDTRQTMQYNGLNSIYYAPANRLKAPKLPTEERDFEKEIEGDIGLQNAIREANRCLSCGNCMACDNCWAMCPDNAVIKLNHFAKDGSHYVFDLDYCKGCGICAKECPTGFIQMVKEE